MQRRNTKQKMMILEVVNDLKHATIDEIFETIQNRHPEISLATIYRNLKLMEKEKLVRRLKINNAQDYYEINRDNHIHLVCMNCGKILDQDNALEPLYVPSQNFKPTLVEVLVYGTCGNCLKKR